MVRCFAEIKELGIISQDKCPKMWFLFPRNFPTPTHQYERSGGKAGSIFCFNQSHGPGGRHSTTKIILGYGKLKELNEVRHMALKLFQHPLPSLRGSLSASPTSSLVRAELPYPEAKQLLSSPTYPLSPQAWERINCFQCINHLKADGNQLGDHSEQCLARSVKASVYFQFFKLQGTDLEGHSWH